MFATMARDFKILFKENPIKLACFGIACFAIGALIL